MEGNNPFGYPIRQYVEVLALACAAGVIKHINSTRKRNIAKFFVDVLTAGFMGVLTFWACEAVPIRGPMAAVLIATGGLMGNKAFKELESMYRSKLGLKKPEDDAEETK